MNKKNKYIKQRKQYTDLKTNYENLTGIAAEIIEEIRNCKILMKECKAVYIENTLVTIVPKSYIRYK